ncbi:MAG TPA: outer membrane protein assembly factor BamD [Burkholderiaceae bacterium]|nr:outer membrane protein assembly factor BamD [Burkholderiaceae bacterium]
MVGFNSWTAPLLRQIAIVLAALALGGCSWLGMDELFQKDNTAKWDADRLYAEARAELSAGNWVKAREYYQKLEARYPFGRHAQQALMEIAYTYYKEGETAQAVQTADRFIRQYPNNPNVDYMYYLKGLAGFGEDTGLLGRLLSQDISQRDAKGARESYDAFRELVTRYPDSKYAEDARARMRYLINSLAKAELLAANFYYVRKGYIAAIQRAQIVVRDFQTSPAAEDALILMAKSYQALEMPDLQADVERVLAVNFPESPYLRARR